MGDEQQRRALVREPQTEASVVQRRNDGLPRASCCHHEIPVTVVDNALNVEQLQHLRLVGVGPHFQSRQGQGDSIGLPAAGRLRECIIESVTISIRVVALECCVVPVRLEGSRELVDQRGSGDSRQSDVPLDAVQHGRAGQV